MSGHSKWANIKHRKGKQDILRGKIFTKLIREITVAARQGADENSNFKLRLAVDKALAQNMSRDTIDRAIKRGAGGEANDNLEEVVYEGYGTNGVALMIECLTDNRNRTVSNVRYVLSKHGGNLGNSGSVAYLFKQCSVIVLATDCEEEAVMEIALEHGAEDVTTLEDGSIEVLGPTDRFWELQQALSEDGMKISSAELTRIAQTKISLDEEASEKLFNLVSALEELDDVQDVYTNAE